MFVSTSPGSQIWLTLTAKQLARELGKLTLKSGQKSKMSRCETQNKLYPVG